MPTKFSIFLLFFYFNSTYAAWPHTIKNGCIYTLFFLSAQEDKKETNHPSTMCKSCFKKMKNDDFICYAKLDSKKTSRSRILLNEKETSNYFKQASLSHINNEDSVSSIVCLPCWTSKNDIEEISHINFPDDKDIKLELTDEFKNRVKYEFEEWTLASEASTHQTSLNLHMEKIIKNYFSSNEINALSSKDEIISVKYILKKTGEGQGVSLPIATYTDPSNGSKFYLFFDEGHQTQGMCFLWRRGDADVIKIFNQQDKSSYFPLAYTDFKAYYEHSDSCSVVLKKYLKNVRSHSTLNPNKKDVLPNR